jgi:hypothetical protein
VAVRLGAAGALLGLIAIFLLAVGTAPGHAARSHPPASHPPARFFGIDPQSLPSGRDGAVMEAGGIRSVRWPFVWGEIEPAAEGGYDWSSTDRLVEVTARHGMTVLPFVVGTPGWLAPSSTSLPVGSRRARHAWVAFLRAAARRYGPGGGFWRTHDAASSEPLPRLPIRTWQIWNEPNFFYFARPISPRLYGRLVEISARALEGVDPRARVLLGGLFGHPHEPRRRGMPAPRFLAALLAVRGIRSAVSGIALHPYAARISALESLVRQMRRVAVRHGDGRVPLYITEMGWGSQSDSKAVGFERSPRGQARDLRLAYRFLLRERRRLRLAAVYWFSWKDLADSCDFCDSTGLFHAGAGFEPKPAWKTFVRITGGRPLPTA